MHTYGCSVKFCSDSLVVTTRSAWPCVCEAHTYGDFEGRSHLISIQGIGLLVTLSGVANYHEVNEHGRP